jgi:hypothetical protein
MMISGLSTWFFPFLGLGAWSLRLRCHNTQGGNIRLFVPAGNSFGFGCFNLHAFILSFGLHVGMKKGLPDLPEGLGKLIVNQKRSGRPSGHNGDGMDGHAMLRGDGHNTAGAQWAFLLIRCSLVLHGRCVLHNFVFR